ncbi:MAG: beta-ketoacyl-[acyl-carrier-protein] synthase II [Verrucomicrobia bacterium]|nr:beta-ketoacyl-[acyl-carrier-protein] synthase II [Verrucomicrobiota bacterium]
MSTRRVVITGLGALTPLANDFPTTWDLLLQGKSGIGPITAFDCKDYDCRIAGEVRNFDPAIGFKNPKEVRRTDRYTHLAMAAAAEAWKDAGLQGATLDADRAGVLVGSGIGGLSTLEEQHSILRDRGPKKVSPFMIPMMINNIASGHISMHYGLRGPNFAIVSACATASHSIGESWRLIRENEADLIVAGGSEAAVVPLGLSGFAAMRALSTRNEEPTRASRPFDKGRDGFVLSEGAAIVVLEEYEHAKKRNARIYGELLGYGATADAHHLTAPAPEGAGAARAMRIALKHANISADQVDYINAHGTSTPQGDICETQAIKSVLGAHAKKVAVSSTKSSLGHLLGAAGSVEMAICLKAIEKSILPATINLEDPDPECDLDYVPHKPREQKIKIVMNNSFGFGGHNACLIASRLV